MDLTPVRSSGRKPPFPLRTRSSPSPAEGDDCGSTSGGSSRRSSLMREQTQQSLRHAGGGGGILAGDEAAVDDPEGLPVGRFFERRPEPRQLVFHQERHHVGEVHLFLFAVRKAG